MALLLNSLGGGTQIKKRTDTPTGALGCPRYFRHFPVPP